MGEEGESWNQYDSNKGINLVTEVNTCRPAGWHMSVIYRISGVVNRGFTWAGMASQLRRTVQKVSLFTQGCNGEQALSSK